MTGVDGDPTIDRDFALMFIVMLTIAAGNTALQSVLPALGRSLGVRRQRGRRGVFGVGAAVGDRRAVLGEPVGPARPARDDPARRRRVHACR